jgi:trehalose 6-phosphate synthase/phosphatase
MRGTTEIEAGERVVVVSNRLPLTLQRRGDEWSAESSAGGLATALEPVLRRTRGLWIGWPGDAPERPTTERKKLLSRWERAHGYVSVEIPKSVSHRFYHGFANRTLWPLFHQFPSRFEFDAKGWDAYVDANHRFRDAVLERLRSGDLVWVHDYQLMLLPQLLREAIPDVALGFFLHIPFPSSDVFRVLPRRDELLRGLLGADFIAFQTHGDLQHFRSSLLRILGIGSRMDRVEADGRFVRLEVLPIGITPEEFTLPIERDRAVQDSLVELRRRFAGRRILLAVDRLDYTKGIPERLRTFRRLLERRKDFHGKVALVQIAVPSRERIPRYRELRQEVSQLVGEINGDFGTPQWTPVVYIHRPVSRPELVALYVAADVGWVTPLRDGMNLVAKEYVACHRGRDGNLVLSEFAGAAAEMGEAFLVNPYDEERTAEAIERALGLAPEEQRERMSALYHRVLRNNAAAWSERFFENLRDAARMRAQVHAEEPQPLPTEAARSAFSAAGRRLLLLDYDGTLVPFANRPHEVVPPPRLLALLTRLSSRPADRVVLVSGRPRSQLDPWFGSIEGLWLAGEHGAILRRPGSAPWEGLRPTLPVEWKTRVRPVLEHFTDRTPGSFIEEKEYSLVWHYRMSDPEFGEWLANELAATLEEMLAESELCAVRGQKSVEVKLSWANKGEVAAQIRMDVPRPAFELAIGDDRTDEDLFERLPDDAWTIHVGEGASRARFRLPGPRAVCEFLEGLCDMEAAKARVKDGRWSG